ncbi:MAG: serine/threonine protein kinase [Rubrivivax sp.]|nr:serine/threonine protein kinase [Rubrivivax sp.]
MTTPHGPGSVVAGYRLRRLIGQGAQSEVWLARRAGQPEPVALKLVALAQGEDAEPLRAAFAAATRAARRLHHPGIVAVHDTGIAGATGWLAMELVPGTDLVRYTRPARLLPEAAVLQVGGRIADALAHAHAQGVVHRDLKPANVLVDWAGDQVKLVDFGLARALGAAQTGTGLVLGTPSYLAPEQLAGAPPTPAGDLYALGVTLFELLAGRLPHEADSMGELLRQVAQQPAPDLRTLRPEVPAMLAALVGRLLAKSPAERPADAATVAAELRHLSRRIGGGDATP